MKKKHQIKYIACTCTAFPSQWEGKTFDDKFIYIRYRYGRLQIGISSNEYQSVYGGSNAEVYYLQFDDNFSGQLAIKEIKKLTRKLLDWNICSFLDDNIKMFRYKLTREQLDSPEYAKTFQIKSLNPLAIGAEIKEPNYDDTWEITADKYKYFKAEEKIEITLKQLAEAAAKQKSTVC